MRQKRPLGLLYRQALQLARLGTLAPSRHNTQPWRFSISENSIRVHPDFSRALPVADPLNRSLYLSLGCVCENILTAAHHYGLSAELDEMDSSDSDSVAIRFRLGRSNSSSNDLLSGLALRQCIRHRFDGERLSRRDLRKLTAASRQPGVQFGLLTQPQEIEKVADVLRAAKKGKKRTAPLAELVSWVRFSASEAESMRDGLLCTEIGYPPMPRCVGVTLIRALVGAHRQTRLSASFVRTSPALMFFVPQKDDRHDWFNVGRSFQRVVLTAASLRIRYAHLQLPYSLRVSPEQLAHCLGCDGYTPLVAARLGYSSLVSHSLRRSVASLLADL